MTRNVQNPQQGETKVVKGGVSPSFEGDEGTFAFTPRKFLRYIKKERVSVNIRWAPSTPSLSTKKKKKKVSL